MSSTTWACAVCHATNAAHRDRCLRCKGARPELLASTVSAAVASGALVLAGGVGGAPAPSDWREALDVSTRQIYYYNAATGETSWARPAAMGAAPLASGWFGLGSVSGGAAQAELLARNAAWLQRPARRQADMDPSRLQRAEGANEYNIWWGRFIGDSWKGGMGREPAPTRCHPERDAGWTKATLTSLTERAAFCIHFARGGCAKGSECTYHHRIPTAEDDGALDSSRDVFGRERHASHRDDMGGVGSMMSNCRTLYVGGLKRPPEIAAAQAAALAAPAAASSRAAASAPASASASHRPSDGAPPLPPPALMAAWEAEVAAHFSPWGEVENINVIARLATAFVRYRYRAGAEFALMAMANQSLGRGEVLNVRWAYDDPNPAAIEARARADEAAVTAALAARGIHLGVQQGPAERPAQEEGEEGGAGGSAAHGQADSAAEAERAREAQIAQWKEEMRALDGWSEAQGEAQGQGAPEQAPPNVPSHCAPTPAAAAPLPALPALPGPAYTIGAAPPPLATFGASAGAAAAALGKKRAREDE